MRSLLSASGRLAALLLLLLSAIQALPSTAAEPRKIREYVDGVPDTGQFLPNSAVLAKVGDRRISVLDYRRAFFDMDPHYRPGRDSVGRAEFLKNMVRKDLLGLTALQVQPPLGFEERAQLRQHEATLISNRLFEQLVMSIPPFSEDTLRTVFSWMQYDVRARWLSFPTRAEAEAAYQSLTARKAKWESVAARYGRAGDDPKGRWFAFRDVPLDVAVQIWPLAPGTISPIVTGVLGYQIAQVLEHRPRAMPIFSIMRPTIEDGLRNYERGRRRLALTREAKGDRVFRYDSTNIAFAARQFFVAVQHDSSGGGGGIVIDERVPEFTDADTARVLVSWDGGRLTLGALARAYGAAPPVLRPVINTPDLLRDFADDMALSPDIERLGRERGLADDPWVKKELAQKREELMVLRMVEDSCFTRIFVTPQERRAYYEANKSQFMTYASEVVAFVVRDTKAQADSVNARLAAGERVEDFLRADSLAGNARTGTKTLTSESHDSMQKLLFEEMRPGDHQVVGPDARGQWAVVEVLSFDPGRLLALDEVEGPISESIQNQKSEAALEAFTARLAKHIPVEAHYDRVMAIKLSTPKSDETE